MHPLQLGNDIFLNLPHLASLSNSPPILFGNPHPRLAVGFDEYDFVLAIGEGVANDYLMAVALEGGEGFGDKEGEVRFELCGVRRSARKVGGRKDGEGRTLNETMNPSLLHSSTIALSTLGT